MATPLYTKDSVMIAAPAANVWETLTVPSHIRSWWGVPMDMGDDSPLTVGRKIIWKDATGKPIAEGEVLSMVPEKSLVIGVHSPMERPAPADPRDFTYSYELVPVTDKIHLFWQTGDFAKIPKGDEHFAEARKFKGTELKKLKELAEIRA